MKTIEQSKSPPANSLNAFITYKNPCLIPLLDQMYKDRNETGDVKFIVESEEILAHRYVLAALSPKYKAQFYGSHRDSGDIKVENVSAAAFNEFLQFFYIEDVSLTIENIEDVLNLAEQSLAENLVNLCKKFLMDTLSLDTINKCLRLAYLFDIKELQEKCDEMIAMNTRELLKSSDFIECDRDTLIYILKSDTMNCKEIEVFDASMKWARAECKRQNINDRNAKNLRSALSDAFFAIRFGLISIKEFASIDRKLFTTAEFNELLQMIGELNDTESSLFSNKPRIPPYYRCNVIESLTKSFILAEMVDSIEFKCNKTIDLYGFVMFAVPFKIINVDIYDGNSLFDNYPKTIQKSNEHFEVLFEKPVQILPFFSPTITISFPGLVTQAGFISLAETEQNGVHFQFKAHNDELTRISQLLFVNLDKS